MPEAVHAENSDKLSVWLPPRFIAILTSVGIALHLIFRVLLNFSVTAREIPLIVVLVIGGIPLIVPLVRKLFALEFGSDHLAGISILTSVVLHEYLVAAIVILMLSGGSALDHAHVGARCVGEAHAANCAPQERRSGSGH